MGSGVSAIIVKEHESEEEKESDFLQETNIEEITVPEDDPGYPKACPPRETKQDIFNKDDFLDIDNRARSAPQDKANNYGELIQYLTQDLQNDLQKLRAIFIWLGQQNIDGEKYSKVTSADTPRGYMKLMKEHKGTYASFFALLCRAAKIPCVIVKGKAKSVGYEVGMTEEECQRLDNSWNAVYVIGGWRLIFPFWACKAVVGHVKEGFVKIEVGGKAVRQREQAASGTEVRQLNEYYFLTNPKDFIFSCFPNEEKWQLLETPWTFQKFAEVPYCRQTYFEQMVLITSSFKCRLQTVNGECTVAVRGKRDIFFNYELYYNEKESKGPISEELQLQRYILKKNEKSDVEFAIRCPHAGVYKLEIVGGKTPDLNSDLCSFKIFCEDPKADCQPLPVSPAIGFGPSYVMERMGVKAQSHKMAIVRIQACKELTMTFTRKRNISVETMLVHNSLEKKELQGVLKQTVKENKITVSIRVIHRGEYALQMFAKPEDSTQEQQNICNYLLTSETGRERTRTHEEKIARNKLNELANTRTDIDGLQGAIETFQDLNLEDKGDLSRAIDALELGRTERDLKDSIRRKRLDCLERAIEQARDSKFNKKLQAQISEAEQQRDDLKKLKTYTHDILEMRPRTISELKSYQQPPQVVHDVMMATYMFFGEKKEGIRGCSECASVYVMLFTLCMLQQWETIRNLLGQTGRESLLRRVKDFEPMQVDLETYADVQDLLKKYTEDDARTASAGAGTFYVWLVKVSEEMVNMSSSA